MPFWVVFLTQKLSSTSWIVTYHVFIAGFAFLDSLNDLILSISELQSSDSDPVDDVQSDGSEMGDFIEHTYKALFVSDTNFACVTVQIKYRNQLCVLYLLYL